jgi:hypothetical protein
VRMETLAGPVVAYEVASAVGLATGDDRFTWQVVVRDLRSGRVLHRVPTGTAPANPFVVGVGPAVSIVVKIDGAVAWVAKAPPSEGTYQLHVLDKTGTRLLASGTDIAPSSLAIAGSRLYWMDGANPDSAPLN